MKYFLKKQQKLIFVIIIFLLFFSIYLHKVFLSRQAKALIPLEPSLVQEEISLPVRLKIPVLGIDAEIEHLGLTSAGAMEVTTDAKNVSWFKLGPLPGAEGSAVIAGHLDDQNGQEAVFYNLNKLKKGDQLFVEDKSGRMIIFVVKETHLYDSQAFVPEVFISHEGQYLNLITCAGDWNQAQKEYAKRLVIFSEQLILSQN